VTTIYIVFDAYLLGRSVAGVFNDEVLALRYAHEYPLPQGVMRRVVEPHAVQTCLAPPRALTGGES